MENVMVNLCCIKKTYHAVIAKTKHFNMFPFLRVVYDCDDSTLALMEKRPSSKSFGWALHISLRCHTRRGKPNGAHLCTTQI